LTEKEPGLLSVCIGITFFAVPHRGSSVLHKHEFSRAVQKRLDLKFEMSKVLRSQFSIEHEKLIHLNNSFGAQALGIPVWNYIETVESRLKVLTDSDGEQLTNVNLKVVDAQSSEIRTGSMSSLLEADEVKPTYSP
jgi:hypothetical protein